MAENLNSPCTLDAKLAIAHEGIVEKDRPIDLKSRIYAFLRPDAAHRSVACEHLDSLETILK
jgi:hypothetical protein